VALRELINLELQTDNVRPSNLLGRNGSSVKEYRRQMEEEGPKASGVRLGEADYKEALGEWIDALDRIATVKTTAQASADPDRALVVNQEQMQTDQLTMRMNEKACRQEQAQANYTTIVEVMNSPKVRSSTLLNLKALQTRRHQYWIRQKKRIFGIFKP
jgi:hypothetical protein